MLNERYEIELDSSYLEFEFDSIGPKGTIKKVVQYSETNLKDLYNLGFGDKNKSSKRIDDLAITNNGDSQKVLATVALTVFIFTEYYHNASVMAIGTTSARTRPYRMGITNNLQAIENDFNIYGLKNDDWEKFVKNVDYDAFLVERKK